MGNIRIDKKTGFAYIPKEIREEGYEGDVETIANALTITLIKPGVSPESAIKSLEIVIQDIKLRAEHAKQQNNIKDKLCPKMIG
jgi:hypothetical protein